MKDLLNYKTIDFMYLGKLRHVNVYFQTKQDVRELTEIEIKRYIEEAKQNINKLQDEKRV